MLAPSEIARCFQVSFNVRHPLSQQRSTCWIASFIEPFWSLPATHSRLLAKLCELRNTYVTSWNLVNFPLMFTHWWLDFCSQIEEHLGQIKVKSINPCTRDMTIVLVKLMTYSWHLLTYPPVGLPMFPQADYLYELKCHHQQFAQWFRFKPCVLSRYRTTKGRKTNRWIQKS